MLDLYAGGTELTIKANTVVRPGEVMLDVGCGSGVSLLEAKALGATAFGVEADPNVKPIAEVLGLSIHFGNLQDIPFPEKEYLT